MSLRKVTDSQFAVFNNWRRASVTRALGAGRIEPG